MCDSSLQEQNHLPFTPLCINIVAAGVQLSEPLSASILFHQTALFLILVVYLFNLLFIYLFTKVVIKESFTPCFHKSLKCADNQNKKLGLSIGLL